MFKGILYDVSVWQPRADEAKREQRLGYPEEGQHVCMRNVLPPNDLTVEPLVFTRLSSPSRRNGEMSHTRLIFCRFAAVWVRKAFTHTWTPSS